MDESSQRSVKSAVRRCRTCAADTVWSQLFSFHAQNVHYCRLHAEASHTCTFKQMHYMPIRHLFHRVENTVHIRAKKKGHERKVGARLQLLHPKACGYYLHKALQLTAAYIKKNNNQGALELITTSSIHRGGVITEKNLFRPPIL